MLTEKRYLMSECENQIQNGKPEKKNVIRSCQSINFKSGNFSIHAF